MSSQAVTLRSLLRRKALAATMFVCLFAAAYVLTSYIGVVGHAFEEPLAERPAGFAEPSRVERLVERYGCWSGEGPAGVIPGHAVVTLPGARAGLVPADVGFGIWLDGKPGTLHAFCR